MFIATVVFKCQHQKLALAETPGNPSKTGNWLFGWALPTIENVYLHDGAFSLPLEENTF